jgi:ribosomal protein S6--L-glutamate ligase
MKLVILSRGRTLYSTRRIAEAGRKRNHDVRVVDPMKCLFGVDEGGRLYIDHDGLEIRDIDAVIPRIGAAASRYHLGTLRQLELAGVAVLNSWSAVALCGDKFASSQVLAANDIPVPKTLTTRTSTQLANVVKRLGGTPIVIKMNSGTQGVGVIIAETMEAVQSTVQTMWSLSQEVVLQEYIAESRGRDLRAFVVDGKIVGAMRREAPEDEFRANVHLGATTVAVRLDDTMRELALKTVDVMGLRVAGVDILESDRGPLVLEVNASPGLQGIEGATGRDIAKSIIKAAERAATQ